MYELPRSHPFGFRCWDENCLSVDGTDTTLFPQDDSQLEIVIWSWDSGDQWDGECAAICQLKDGRFVAWETSYGPTGDGFCEDAYGGDAVLHFAGTLTNVALFGLTPEKRSIFYKDVELDRDTRDA